MEIFFIISLAPLSLLVFYCTKLLIRKLDQTCYVLDYACFKGRDEQKLDTETCAKVVVRNKNLGLDEYRFLLRTMVGSGIGEEACGPKTIMEGKQDSATLIDAHSELDDIMFQTLDKLFAKTGISPSEIDILVTTVSLFSPAPSITARIINRYKMRGNVKVINLSGMGCSGSILGIDVVQQLFKSHKDQLAIVVSTELMGPNWYRGRQKSMMLSNVLFRAGGCSILLTNKRALKHRAMLKLNCIVRTHLGFSDEAYNSCICMEDEQGYKGCYLSRSLAKAGIEALTQNLKVLLPKILPLWELLRYKIVSYYRNKVIKRPPNSEAASGIGINLKTGVQHFCIHPGGRAIIDGIGKSLGLNPYDLEPSRMKLHRFGNTSSSGLWYVLGYMEAKKRLKKGDKVLMISVGAGFKCNNCVWKVMRDVEEANVWDGIIDHYPLSTLVNPFAEKFNWIHDESLTIAKVAELMPKVLNNPE